ncbi:hypothetical protein PoB_004948900 [Plakobranchus ocellatus]|uniref:Uncharacterized protein n=1 Tax=Plakobranchus ocellatus TaxID=259542 RepID=A0AAV4BS28_9GAST|nr:hypothetical protein PoB_004948900 [Plakobranchus ocellatus]
MEMVEVEVEVEVVGVEMEVEVVWVEVEVEVVGVEVEVEVVEIEVGLRMWEGNNIQFRTRARYSPELPSPFPNTRTTHAEKIHLVPILEGSQWTVFHIRPLLHLPRVTTSSMVSS